MRAAADGRAHARPRGSHTHTHGSARTPAECPAPALLAGRKEQAMRRVRTPAVRVQTVHGTTANTRTHTHTHTLTLSRSHSTAVHGTTTNTYATPALLAGRDGQGVK